MKNGIELITEERLEQIKKHGRSVEDDALNNVTGQLATAASILCMDFAQILEPEDVIKNHCPDGWDSKAWRKMVEKPYLERLKIAGALIAAEIDRANYILNLAS